MIRRELLRCVVAIVAIAFPSVQVASFCTALSRSSLKGHSSPLSSLQTTSPSLALNAVKKGTARPSTKEAATKKASAMKEYKKKNIAAKEAEEEVLSLKKADFVKAVAEKTGMTRGESDLALAAVLNVIATQVADGKRISLPGFGTFKLNFRAARKGRNPATGEEIYIKASYSPSFSASKTFKEMCNPHR